MGIVIDGLKTALAMNTNTCKQCKDRQGMYMGAWTDNIIEH